MRVNGLAIIALACAAVAPIAGGPSWAQGPAPGPSAPAGSATPAAPDRKAAAQAFSDGETAFKRGDFAGAAAKFEQAYRLAPHPFPLLNAARAWKRAGMAARSATLYAHYLREAPADAADRGEANKAIAELGPKLGRLAISAAGLESVTVDGERTDEPVVYVTAGGHVVEAHQGDRTARAEPSVEAGQELTVTLSLPSAVTAPSASATASAAPASTEATAGSASVSATASAGPTAGPERAAARPPERTGWSPIVVYVGGGVTLAGAIATIASGVDTNRFKHDTYNSQPTLDNYNTGVDKMHRTNILLGVTLVAAGFTAVAALWLVDWGGPSHVQVGLGPDGLRLRGRF